MLFKKLYEKLDTLQNQLIGIHVKLDVIDSALIELEERVKSLEKTDSDINAKIDHINKHLPCCSGFFDMTINEYLKQRRAARKAETEKTDAVKTETEEPQKAAVKTETIIVLGKAKEGEESQKGTAGVPVEKMKKEGEQAVLFKEGKGKWTEREDTLLRHLYDSLTKVEFMVPILGRSENAIRHRAQRLGLTLHK